MLMPSSAIEGMDLGSPAGLAALQKLREMESEESERPSLQS
jgi:hypothetical protein